MIKTLENDHPGALVDFLAQFGAGPLPTAASTTTVPAEINHGRWIVKCPFCASAQQASEADPRWFCVDCKNAKAGGKWLPVVWPANRAKLEAILTARPDVNTRNWLPTETVQDLLRENVQKGV